MATNQTAPGELELVREFVNTLDLETEAEQLSSPQRLRDWLAERELIPAGAKLDGSDLARAVELREALRGLLLANNGVPPRDRDVRIVDRATASSELAVRRRHGGAGAARVRARRRDRTPGGDRLRGNRGRTLGAAEGVPRRRLPLGLLRPLAEPLRHVVHDGRVREQIEGARIPRATREITHRPRDGGRE